MGIGIALMERDEMDKQTAIDLLDNLLGMVEDNHGSDYDKAIHMGIDALKMQLSVESTTFPVDGEPLDCISRQQAMLCIERNAYRRDDINETEKVILWVLDIIKWLPSVQPDLQPTCNKLATDCIDRQAAIDAVCEYCEYFYNENVIQSIKEIPSVQPQRWIPVTERLPEPDERVAVTTGGYEYHVWDCMSNRGDDYFWEDEEGDYHNKYAAVAWMPLPEPWRGQDDN